MADEVKVPESCLVYLPSKVDVGDGCLVEPRAVAVHGMRRAGLDGQRVAVIGGGTIGLCAVAVARDSSSSVGLSTSYDRQMATGILLGADQIDGQYDLVVEAAGTERAVNKSIALCRPKGTVLMLETHWSGLQFQQMAAMMKEITVISSYMYAANDTVRDFDVAAMLLSKHPEIAKALITHRFRLAEVKQAFGRGAGSEGGRHQGSAGAVGDIGLSATGSSLSI
jgi:threonine dehydrogenase-like Zn-dependent dehydrogenase